MVITTHPNISAGNCIEPSLLSAFLVNDYNEGNEKGSSVRSLNSHKWREIKKLKLWQRSSVRHNNRPLLFYRRAPLASFHR